MPAEIARVLGRARGPARRDQTHRGTDITRPRSAHRHRTRPLQYHGRESGAAAVAGRVSAAEAVGDGAVSPRAAPGLDRDAEPRAHYRSVVERDARLMPVAADAVTAIGSVRIAPQAAIAARGIQVYSAASSVDRAGRQDVVDDPPAAAIAPPVILVGIPAVAAMAAADVDQDAGLAGPIGADALVAVRLHEVALAPLAVMAIVGMIAAGTTGAVGAAQLIGQRRGLGERRPPEDVEGGDSRMQKQCQPGKPQAVAAGLWNILRGDHGCSGGIGQIEKFAVHRAPYKSKMTNQPSRLTSRRSPPYFESRTAATTLISTARPGRASAATPSMVQAGNSDRMYFSFTARNPARSAPMST